MEVKLWLESDQKLEGVVRLKHVEIFLKDGSENVEVEHEIWDKFCVKEYNTNILGWDREIKLEVAKELGCDVEDITVE